MSPMEDDKKSKWNWPYKGGAAVAEGLRKAKEKGPIANAYEAIKQAMSPTDVRDTKTNSGEFVN